MSAAVRTPATPGMAAAARRVDAADQGVGEGLCTAASSSAPGRSMSAVNSATPQALSMAEGRGCETPILGPSGSGQQRVGRGLAAQERAGQLDRLDDLHVAGAAAEVVAQGVPDLLGRGIGVDVEQRLGRHDHAGDAEAALHGPGQHEGLLDEVRVGRRAQALDGDDVGAVEPAILVVHERIALPLTMTVQAPHWPLRSHDCLAPVRRYVSRSTSSRIACGSVTTCRVTPLIVRRSLTNSDLPVDESARCG